MGSKSKTVAILLAVFLCPVAWLYTYREDNASFWAWVGIVAVGVVLGFVAPTLGIITSLAGFAYWIWTIVSIAKRPADWYTNYNMPSSPGRDWRRAA